MEDLRPFKAHLSLGIKIVTALVLIALAAVIWGAVSTARASGLAWIIVLPILLMIVISYLLSIKGYAVGERSLFILRPIGRKRVDLSGLHAAEIDPNVLRGSLRVCGNGGFFACTGWFWNRRLKMYRAWITNPKNAVLLTLADRRIVVSPDDPADFVATVSAEVAKNSLAPK